MSFYGVTDVWAYLAGAFAIILLPRPNSLYLLSVVTLVGTRLANAFDQRKRWLASLPRLVGGRFVGFGAKLASANLN